MEHLRHPHIVEALSFGVTSEGQLYLAMQWIQGPTLADIIAQNGPLDLLHFKTIFTQVLKALAHAHAKGFVHKDLKPTNIMLESKTGDVKLLDFGIAQALEAPGTSTSQLMTQGSSSALGTPLYMSPEQCSEGHVDRRSDIYSLGCVMYEALAGHPPFSGDTPMQIVLGHTQTPPPALPDSVAGWLESVVYVCLAKNPADRYDSAEQLLQDLTDERASRTPVHKNTDSAENRWHKLAKLPVTMLAAGIATILALHILQPKQNSHDATKENTVTQPQRDDAYKKLSAKVLDDKLPVEARIDFGLQALKLLEPRLTASESFSDVSLRGNIATLLIVQHRTSEALKIIDGGLDILAKYKNTLPHREFARSNLILLTQKSRCLDSSGDAAGAIQAMLTALAPYWESDAHIPLHSVQDQTTVAQLSLELARAAAAHSLPKQALQAALQGERFASYTKDRPTQLQGLILQANAYEQLNQPEKTLAALETSYALAQELGNKKEATSLGVRAAQLHGASDNLKTSEQFYLKVAALNADHPYFQTGIYAILADLTDKQGKTNDSAGYLRKAFAVTLPSDSLLTVTRATSAATIYCRHKNIAQATSYLDQALRSLEQIKPDYKYPDYVTAARQAYITGALVAGMKADRASKEKMLGYLIKAEEVAAHINTQLTAEPALQRAQVLLDLHRDQEADVTVNHVLDICQSYPYKDSIQGCAQMIKAEICVSRNDYKHACIWLEQALSIRRNMFGKNHKLTGETIARLSAVRALAAQSNRP